MKSKYTTYLLIALSAFIYLSCKGLSKVPTTDCCDSSHRAILIKFANVLNSLVLNYKAKDDEGLYDKNSCRLVGTFIWDITDTLKKETATGDCIEFKEGHVYHFAPIRKRDSYSNIAIIKNGEPIIFKALNCPGKGETIEDVVTYIKDNFPKTNETQFLLTRVMNYRNYGKYTKTDEQSEFKCN